MESSSRKSFGKSKIAPAEIETKENYELDDVEKSSTASKHPELSITEKYLEKEDDDEFDSDDENETNNVSESKNFLAKLIIGFRIMVMNLLKQPLAPKILLGLFLIGFIVYFGFAMDINNPFAYTKLTNRTNTLQNHVFANNRGLAFLILTLIICILIIWDKFIAKLITGKFSKPNFLNNKIIQKFGSWIVMGLIAVAIVVYLIFSVTQAYNLVSLTGLAMFVLVSILISAHPAEINWRILVAGLEIQFILGVFLMRTEFGYQLFKFLSNQVATFLAYTDRGTQLVFGPFLVYGDVIGNKVFDSTFAFRSIPVIIFFSAVINLLYYFGFVQYMILKLAWLVNLIMGTSPTESMNATANIFLGITEAPLLIKPFLEKMTRSEIFSVMTSGFATVAGSVLAAYINFKIPANHLVIASLMAAPAALTISKTIHPETKTTKANWDAIRSLPKGDAKNVFEAISIGASNAVGPVAGIISNLIAFTASFAFIDAFCMWIFSMIGLNNFGVTSIMQYIFYPFVFLMGVSINDVQTVSKLIGIKMFVNEFAAFFELGKAIKFRDSIIENGLYNAYKNGSLPLPNDLYMVWEDRSILISTYALCGFANFASMGIAIGGLGALAPKRLKVFAKFAFKAMIAGNITNFCTACIAGVFVYKAENFKNYLDSSKIDLFTHRIVNRQSKCIQGSFSFNGSCYFISDIKQINLIQEGFKKFNESSVSNSDKSLFLLKSAKWNESQIYCKQLDLYSNLIQFEHGFLELEYLTKLIRNLTSKKNEKFYEQKYWIGLTFNVTWKWFNGSSLNNLKIESLIDLRKIDLYRQCAYLNIRENEIIIELGNCKYDQYGYICKYVLDYCFDNSNCGKNGHCVNNRLKQSYECSCRIFYEGPFCDKLSNHGKQMVVSISIVTFGFIFLTVKKVKNIFRKLVDYFKKKNDCKSNKKWKRIKLNKYWKILFLIILSISISMLIMAKIFSIRSKNFVNFLGDTNLTQNFIGDQKNGFDLCKVIDSQFLEDSILIIISLSLTLIIYFWNAFKCNRNHEYFCRFSKFSRNREESRNSESEESNLSLDYNVNNYKNTNKNRISRFLSLKKFRNFTFCGFRCICGIEFPIPMNTFSKRNRFLTGVIYAAYTYNILKIFEFLLIGEAPSQALSQGKYLIKNLNISMTSNLSAMSNQLTNSFQNTTQKFTNMTEQGILMDLIKRITGLISIALKYYPILLTLNLEIKRKFCDFLCIFYLILIFSFEIYSKKASFLSISSSNFEKLNYFIAENLIFYTINCFIVWYMIIRLMIDLIRLFNQKETKKSFKSGKYLYENDIKYTKKLLSKNDTLSRNEYFRFSQQFVTTNMVSFILLYKLPFKIISKSSLIIRISNQIVISIAKFFIDFNIDADLIQEIIELILEKCESYIIAACCLTSVIYAIQLIFGIKKYKKNVLDAYKGVYKDIPSINKIQNYKTIECSLNYSGYSISYLLWGYLILFEVSLVLIIVTKFLIRFYFLTENLAKLVLPILTIYLLKRILLWYLCSYFITENSHSTQRFVLKNRKFYFILNHVNYS
ncbi:unnamed protein product [Brachionus calyciflorus]|uniref:Sodium/nucleoside cotransporter n=1 Tax=Brachionus calyciflorus TaxID=104777 RepID=A0A813MLD9_9BILA|nr:unnamed protein product [Brachionus calyciflorus]